MAQRRAEPRDDLVSDLLAAADRGAPIDDNEILHNLFALLTAGHLTTADLIGNGVHLLLSHPDARRAVAENPKRIQAAVEEILRYEPPISFTARFAKDGGAIGGWHLVNRRGDGSENGWSGGLAHRVFPFMRLSTHCHSARTSSAALPSAAYSVTPCPAA